MLPEKDQLINRYAGAIHFTYILPMDLHNRFRSVLCFYLLICLATSSIANKYTACLRTDIWPWHVTLLLVTAPESHSKNSISGKTDRDLGPWVYSKYKYFLKINSSENCWRDFSSVASCLVPNRCWLQPQVVAKMLPYFAKCPLGVKGPCFVMSG